MNPTLKINVLAPLGLVMLNVFLAHFTGIGIFGTAIVLPLAAAMVTLPPRSLNVWMQSLLCFLMAALNDLGIKLYAGGTHDDAGLGWMLLLLLVGLAPMYVFLIVSVIRNKTASILEKLGAILLFPALMVLYLHYFQKAGLGRYY
jgi:hypothetical protein